MALKFGMQSVFGVGDQYVAALGLRNDADPHVVHDSTPSLQFAVEVLRIAQTVRDAASNENSTHTASDGSSHLRIGIGTGPCDGALLGTNTLYYNAGGPALTTAKSNSQSGAIAVEPARCL